MFWSREKQHKFMFEKDNKEALLKKNAPGTYPGQTKDKPEPS